MRTHKMSLLNILSNSTPSINKVYNSRSSRHHRSVPLSHLTQHPSQPTTHQTSSTSQIAATNSSSTITNITAKPYQQPQATKTSPRSLPSPPNSASSHHSVVAQ